MNVNWASLTATVANLLEPCDIPCLRTLVLGGEASTKKIVETWSPALDLIIAYGPAECSINCLGAEPAKLENDPADLGYAIGCRLWITDTFDHNRLAPIGCIGELLVEGPIVARGYLHDKAKTEAAFVVNPAWVRSDKVRNGEVRRRFYKTGDLVRYNPDGTIHYVKRKDTQVKVHGQRVELGEIEYHVRNQLQDMQRSAVDVVTTGTIGKQTLAVFFCPKATGSNRCIPIPLNDGLKMRLMEVQATIADLVPVYMVPSLFIPLEQMPITASGKLDRTRLKLVAQELTPGEVAHYSFADEEKRAPASEMEVKIQALWADVLGLPVASIGADDTFFRLGGDSVTAMRLVTTAQVRNIPLTVADIFRQPQLSKLAAIIDESQNGYTIEADLEPFCLLPISEPLEKVLEEAAAICGVPSTQIEDMYPCTPLQEGLMTISMRQTGANLHKWHSECHIPSTLRASKRRGIP